QELARVRYPLHKGLVAGGCLQRGRNGMATKRIPSEKKVSAPKRTRAKTAGTVDTVELENVFSIDHDAIARRAFERYAARGMSHGNDLDDCLAAERELARG